MSIEMVNLFDEVGNLIGSAPRAEAHAKGLLHDVVHCWFVDSQEKMREIVRHFPEAAAVDMESASIAQTCHCYSIPFISFRVISDIPLKDNNASQYHDFWNTVSDTSFEMTKKFLERI